MNQPSEPRFAIRLPSGQCLGRYSIHSDIVPVPPVFAHTFTDLAEAQAHLDHARTAMGFPGAVLVPLSECLDSKSESNPNP
jgi:hypothetical protein